MSEIKYVNNPTNLLSILLQLKELNCTANHVFGDAMDAIYEMGHLLNDYYHKNDIFYRVAHLSYKNIDIHQKYFETMSAIIELLSKEFKTVSPQIDEIIKTASQLIEKYKKIHPSEDDFDISDLDQSIVSFRRSVNIIQKMLDSTILTLYHDSTK